MEPFEELRSIGHVLRGVEHISNGGEFSAVKIDVDLHAADVDQLRAATPGVINHPVGLWHALRKIGLAFDVDGIGTQRALASRLRQADRIENTFRYSISASCCLYLSLAVNRCCGLGSLTGKGGQDERWNCEQVLQTVKCFHD